MCITESDVCAAVLIDLSIVSCADCEIDSSNKSVIHSMVLTAVNFISSSRDCDRVVVGLLRGRGLWLRVRSWRAAPWPAAKVRLFIDAQQCRYELVGARVS